MNNSGRIFLTFGLIVLFLMGLYYLLTHFPKATDSIVLDDGSEIKLSYTENYLVFLDPEIDKRLSIRTGNNTIHHELVSEDNKYDLLLINSNGKKYWVIQDGALPWILYIAPYDQNKAEFEQKVKYPLPADTDTICHLDFDAFELNLRSKQRKIY